MRMVHYNIFVMLQCHRDARKRKKIGTLVIQLPSDYSGGELIVYHESKNTTFDFSGQEGSDKFHYAAFYADCMYEIKPVTRGHCLRLVYDLEYTGSAYDCPVPQNKEEIVSSLVSSMKEWSAHTDSVECPLMMCYMLEHKYNKANLSFERLKNIDRAVASVLAEASKEVDFDLCMGRVILTEKWLSGCEYTCCSDHDYVEIDHLSDTFVAKHLQSPEGLSIPNVKFNKQCHVPEDLLSYLDRDPDKEQIAKYTGNNTVIMNKFYKWAAILLWPTENRVANIGASNMISKLSLDLDSPSADKDELAEVARGILRYCARRDSQHHSDVSAEKCESLDVSAEKYESFLQSLLKIGNTELVLDGLEVILGSSSSLVAEPSFADKVVDIGNTYGWNVLVTLFSKVHVSVSSSVIDHFCKFLHCILGSQPSDVQKDVCLGLGRAIISALPVSQPVSYYSRSRNIIVFPDVYESLLEGLLKIGDAVLISEGLKSILRSSSSFLISQTSFGDKILTVGRTFGWSVLKPPLEAGFKHVSTSVSAVVDCCKLLRHILGSQPSDAKKDLCVGLTDAIIHVLSGCQVEYSMAESYESLLQVLMEIGEDSHISEGLKFAFTSCSASLIRRTSFSEQVVTIGRSCGWNVLKAPLEDTFGKLKPDSKLIEFLKCIYGTNPSDTQKDVCRGLASVVVTTLSSETDTKSPDRGKQFLFLLFQFLLTLEDNNTLLSLVQVIITKSNYYSLFDTLIPICEEFASSGNDSFKLLISHCIACLESSRSFPCSYGWSQPVMFSCSCDDCVLVMQFLKNSTQFTQTFRMQLRRRMHIERHIKYKNCSVTCATVRVGTPHGLVVTKILSDSQKAAQCDKLKKSTLSRLRALAGLFPSSSRPAGKQQEPSSSTELETGVGLGPSSNAEKQQSPSSASTELPTSGSVAAAAMAIGPSSSIGSTKKRRESSISLLSSGSEPTSSSGYEPAEKRPKISDDLA